MVLTPKSKIFKSTVYATGLLTSKYRMIYATDRGAFFAYVHGARRYHPKAYYDWAGNRNLYRITNSLLPHAVLKPQPRKYSKDRKPISQLPNNKLDLIKHNFNVLNPQIAPPEFYGPEHSEFRKGFLSKYMKQLQPYTKTMQKRGVQFNEQVHAKKMYTERMYRLGVPFNPVIHKRTDWSNRERSPSQSPMQSPMNMAMPVQSPVARSPSQSPVQSPVARSPVNNFVPMATPVARSPIHNFVPAVERSRKRRSVRIRRLKKKAANIARADNYKRPYTTKKR